MSCVGCGLIDDITEQRVAVSSTWGGPGLGGFGENDQLGGPVYCDESLDEIRTSPPIFNGTSEGAHSNGSPVPFAGGRTNKLTGLTFTITNPSSTRPAVAFLLYTVKWGFTMSTTGGSIVLGSDLNVDGVTINTLARTWGLPFTSAYSHEEIELDCQMIFLPPGGSVTVEFEVYIDSTGWSGTGSYDSARVAYWYATRSA